MDEQELNSSLAYLTEWVCTKFLVEKFTSKFAMQSVRLVSDIGIILELSCRPGPVGVVAFDSDGDSEGAGQQSIVKEVSQPDSRIETAELDTVSAQAGIASSRISQPQGSTELRSSNPQGAGNSQIQNDIPTSRNETSEQNTANAREQTENNQENPQPLSNMAADRIEGSNISNGGMRNGGIWERGDSPGPERNSSVADHRNDDSANVRHDDSAVTPNGDLTLSPRSDSATSLARLNGEVRLDESTGTASGILSDSTLLVILQWNCQVFLKWIEASRQICLHRHNAQLYLVFVALLLDIMQHRTRCSYEFKVS